MKKILYLFLLFLPILSFTQSRYGVEGVPVCWRTPLGVDSSLNRYVIISSTGKPVQTIVYENANGVVVNVSGGSMRYGYCDCIDFTVPDSSVTWEMLTEPVKDSIRFAKRDTFITVPPSTNYIPNLVIENPARLYNNVYLSCKGRTDTSIVAFLGVPVWEEQKGVTYNVKNDSGLVAAFVISNEHLSNSKRLYLLKRGQTAQVRLLPDAANPGQYGWAVNVVWDSIFDSQIVNPKWLYVSKATGNNGTAQKGNPNKPWSDPFAAKEEAVVGDEIFVSDGIWEYGENDEIDSGTISGLLKDGVTYHFSQGTKILTHRSEDQYNNDTLGLFYTNQTVNCRILGLLDIEVNWDSPSVWEAVLGFRTGNNSSVTIQIDSLIELDFYQDGTSNFPVGLVDLSVNYLTGYDVGFAMGAGIANVNIKRINYFTLNAIAGATIFASVLKGSLGSSQGLYLTGENGSNIHVQATDTNVASYFNSYGKVFIDLSDGNLDINPGFDSVYAVLTNVELKNLIVPEDGFAEVLMKNCYVTDSLALYFYENSRTVLSGTIDLLSTGYIYVRDFLTSLTAVDFKGLMFKDVLFFNPNPSYLIKAEGSYTGLEPLNTFKGVVFLNCWSNQTPTYQRIQQYGEPVSTY